MAKKGKVKISKLKRNNHTTNKMKKRGTLKLQRHRAKVQKQRQPSAPDPVYESDSDGSGSGDEWADMLDDAEKEYMERRLALQPQLLSSVPQKDEVIQKQPKIQTRKRSRVKTQQSDSGAESDSEAEIEDKYIEELASQPKKKLRPLLPIKTKDGLIMQAEECDDSDKEIEAEPPAKKTKPSETTSDGSDSGLEGAIDDDDDQSVGEEGEVINAVQLVMARRERIKKDKLRIGALCSSLLESPEKKLKNFYPILFLMEEKLKDESENLLSIRKLATLSAYEVFKDILPEYSIRHQDYSNIKLKKDTLALYKYEKELLEFYKRYLQRLEKAMAVVRPKKGDNRKLEESSLTLATIAVQCMSGLLVARPYFNYSTNIAQSIVPLLDCKHEEIRTAVSECCTTVFQEDSKGEITLMLVRLINQLVKRRGIRVRPQALDCLLDLNMKDISLDEEMDVKIKQKKEEKHKKRIVNLSKKEKKRAKKLREVEHELLETQAQESVVQKNKHLTEVTKTLFHIYFRILKTAPHSALLAAALKGLAKFTHVINLEYYSDLVSILSKLVSDGELNPRERLLCVKTVLSILAGKGDALNVDPAAFHAHLYDAILSAHSGKTYENIRVILESVIQVSHRSRRVTSAVLHALCKRLATLCLQVPHHAALGALAILSHMMQSTPHLQRMVQTQCEPAGGRYSPYSPSPEHSGAHAAYLHDLTLLATHYHEEVRRAAAHLLHARPLHIHRSPLQIFDEYNGSTLCFKPAIPPPKPKPTKNKVTNEHTWVQTDFRDLCDQIEENVSTDVQFHKYLSIKL